MGNLCDSETSQLTKTSLSYSKMPIQQNQIDTTNNTQKFYTAPIDTQKKKIGLEDFVMLGTVGKGAFGKVYKVKKKDNLKIYAMKAMNKKIIIDSRLQENAVIEKDVLKKSKHPFIVNLKYSFQTPTKLYFVMEYIGGGEFFKILQQTKGLPEQVVAFVTAEVVLALEYLNTQLKVIYRDLKPENILLTTTGHVKLTDFGLATLKKEHDEKTYTLAGTPEYLAPEIITKEGHSFEVDLWTLGILIFEMIHGQPPFTHPERNLMKIKHLILQNNPTYPPTMSEEAKDLISKLLKTNPKERLGANSYSEIKQHQFFSRIKWEELYNLTTKSPLKSFAEENSQKQEARKPLMAKFDETPNPPQPTIQGISFAGNEGETLKQKKL